MGSSKRELGRQEDNHHAAQDIACQAGVLKECDFHSDMYTDTGESREEAYRLGNTLYTKEDALTSSFTDRREMTDTIKAVCDEAPEDCPMCEKWKED